MLVILFLSACSGPQVVHKPIHTPDEQCDILVKKKLTFKSNKKSKIRRTKTIKQPEIDPATLQAQLLTEEEYLQQVEKVQKSLPQFDIEKDCPPAFKKTPVVRKKFSLKSFFKKYFK